MDLGFLGPRFTWTNKRTGKAKIREQIDQTFCNSQWKQRFPKYVIWHLPRMLSDHHPLLIVVSDLYPILRQQNRFYLKEMLYRHMTFNLLIQQFW